MPEYNQTNQSGSVLLEALIAILIFSLGILAIVGLQATMVKAASDAKYRTEAGLYANRLLGEMWAADRSASLSDFATGGSQYTSWYSEMQNTNAAVGLLGLPGVTINPPQVTVTAVNNPTKGYLTSQNVTISIFWQAPGAPVHQHVVAASISAD